MCVTMYISLDTDNNQTNNLIEIVILVSITTDIYPGPPFDLFLLRFSFLFLIYSETITEVRAAVEI